jgi:hypothetical protein
MHVKVQQPLRLKRFTEVQTNGSLDQREQDQFIQELKSDPEAARFLEQMQQPLDR